MSPLPNGSDPWLAESSLIPVTELTQAGEARRTAVALSRRLRFEEDQCGKVALVVTEAATNLVKHAGGGEILLQPVEQDSVPGLDVLALDRGPGMADLDRCLRDGYSSTGTLGAGLGAIIRLSASFHIHTAPQNGTALIARLWSGPVPPAAGPFEVGGVRLPRPRETVCGDCWAVEQAGSSCRILVADGLGHGPLAAEASQKARAVFHERIHLPLVEIMEHMHGSLGGTRGAAVALAEIDAPARTLRFVGIGNISGTILTRGASQSVMSHHGTVGHRVRRVQEVTYPFADDSLLVMHSDGLATQWRLDPYPGLSTRAAGLIAAVLFRDFRRDRDDVAVVAVRAGEARLP